MIRAIARELGLLGGGTSIQALGYHTLLHSELPLSIEEIRTRKVTVSPSMVDTILYGKAHM
jgi:hypothetical protein